MSFNPRHSTRLSKPEVMVGWLLSAVLLAGVATFSFPADVLGATARAAICNANLRTSPSTLARARTVASIGTKVSVVATVTGGSWRTTCAGKTTTGTTWYRISAINGKTVRSLYGVSYLYSVTSLWRAVAVPITRYAACRANLRVRPSGLATIRARINTDTKVLVAATVTGTRWSATCAGKVVTGTAWYRISAINGRSVNALYGVSYLYGARGLFKTSVATTLPPVVTPPTPVPTPPSSSPPPPGTASSRPYDADSPWNTP